MGKCDGCFRRPVYFNGHDKVLDNCHINTLYRSSFCMMGVLMLVVLEKKACQNFQISELAHQQNHYDVAVSRRYYSIYQLLKSKLMEMGLYYPEKGNTYLHTRAKGILTDYCKTNDIPRQYHRGIHIWDKLKKDRHQADYEGNRLLTKDDFKVFCKNFDNFVAFLKSASIIEKEPWETE